MKLKKCILFIAISAIPMILAFSDSMASYDTYGIVIQSPQEGDLWQTGEQVIVKWTVYCVGHYPGDGIVHYMIKLEGDELTYGYYNQHNDSQVPGCFTMQGLFRYVVPGNGNYRNPNAILTVMSGKQDCPNCYDLDGIGTVSIRLKMWYDPIPIPITEAPSRHNITESPRSNYLSEPYPNPFNPQTTICFGLKEAANVSMKIYNVDGRLVKTLHNSSFMQAGEYRENWNGLNDYGAKVPSGIYFLKLNASNGYSNTQKMVLIQ